MLLELCGVSNFAFNFDLQGPEYLYPVLHPLQLNQRMLL